MAGYKIVRHHGRDILVRIPELPEAVEDALGMVEERDRLLRVMERRVSEYAEGVGGLVGMFPLGGGEGVGEGLACLLLRGLRFHEISVALSGLSFFAVSRLMELELIGLPIRTYWDLVWLLREVFGWAVGRWVSVSRQSLSLRRDREVGRLILGLVGDAGYLVERRLSRVLRRYFDNLRSKGTVRWAARLYDGEFRARDQARYYQFAAAMVMRLRHVMEFTVVDEWDEWRLEEALGEDELKVWRLYCEGRIGMKRPYCLGLPEQMCAPGKRAYLFEHRW